MWPFCFSFKAYAPGGACIFRKSCLGLLLLASCAVHTARAQAFRFEGSRKKGAISFRYIRNLVIVPLYVNGKGPYNFILDTGVGPTIITDSAIAAGIDRKKLRPIKISGLGKGPELEALLSNEFSARLGRAGISYMPAAVLDEELLGLSNYVGMKISGLLGYYFFKSFTVRISYSGRRIVFYERDPKKEPRGERVPLVLINNKPYADIGLELPGQGRMTARVVVDNGASHALSLETLSGKAFPLPAGTVAANLGVGLSGPISGSLGRTDILQLGSFTFRDVVTAYPVYGDTAISTYLKDRNGNMGAEVLSRFNITFDYADSAMYLRRNETFKRPFEHDMSGMELYVTENFPTPVRYFVSRVEPGSPAALAGIQEGDELLSINLNKTGSMNLDELNRYLRQGDGRSLLLTLNREGGLLVKTIKLKKRI